MFITFEGIDFCGKSTQVELLKDFLINNKKDVQVLREPGGTELAEKIRTILLDKENMHMTIETEIFLFSASRAQLVREKIRPYIKKDFYIILDRFHDSTTAYQGFGRGISLESVKHINNIAVGETLPDLTFFIDIPVEEAERRKKNSNPDLDRIENSEKNFFEKVRKGYQYLTKNEKRFRQINGLLPINEIHNQIINEITLLEKKELV